METPQYQGDSKISNLGELHGDQESVASEQVYEESVASDQVYEESETSEQVYCYDYNVDPSHGQYSEIGSESGVEPDYNEWIFDENAIDAMFDITNEQALAALKYFTSTANRTNMMTKTHGFDLDLISQLLVDKEKDLDMAAKIGQSLLQRNKDLLMKIEQMEDYLVQTKDNEMQLQHDLKQKNEIARMYFEEDERRSYSSDGSKECDDAEIRALTVRCRALEKENQNLFSEALNIRDVTNEMEEKEEGLVLDCIEQLSSTKQQITALTDEIAQKFEDNVQQQEEITQLIDMVVDLQKNQKQLCTDNEELQGQLIETQNDKDSLREQLAIMQAKFKETYELLQGNQEEMKNLKSRLDFSGGSNPSDWLNDSGNSMSLQDSLANEIEESVRRDLIYTQERRKQNKKVMDNVRYLNVKSTGASSISTSGRTSPMSTWSLASDERSDTMSTVSTIDCDGVRTRKSVKKLQIVKPMEGSDTLSKWQNLASQNVKEGFNVAEVSPRKTDVSVDHENSTTTVTMETTQDISVVVPDTSPPLKEMKSPPHILKPIKPHKQSMPSETKTNSLLKGLETPASKKKTIITRNSTALQSLRKGRRMLRNKDQSTRSQAEVIDMIASAMGKAHIEVQTGRRILSSLSNNITESAPRRDSIRQRAETLTKSPDIQEMPIVSKILEKVAHNAEALGLSASDLDSEIDDAPPSTPRLPIANELNSVTGPLGLLNRADLNEPNPMLRDRLLRLSSIDTNAPNPSKMTDIKPLSSVIDTSGNNSGLGLGLRRNRSSGSLVEMMVNNKLNAGFRPVGLASLVNNSSGSIDDSGLLGLTTNNVKSSSSAELGSNSGETSTLPKQTSKSVETGLDVKTPDNNRSSGGGFGFFSSFLGKLS